MLAFREYGIVLSKIKNYTQDTSTIHLLVAFVITTTYDYHQVQPQEDDACI